MNYLQVTDPEIARLIKLENKRQEETLMMIPSENYTSRAVEETLASSLGNKYAEGYPGKRYYQGQAVVDQVENLVIERAKKLFHVESVNVQALSGSPANFAVYTALLSPGDTLMGLTLSSGGHLTHGALHNASSKYFHSVPYDVDSKGYIDYVALKKLAIKEKPKIIIASTTAYARFLDWKKFADIANEVNAYLMADISHIAGLILTEVYPSPTPFAHIITTTTHKTLRGPRGALIMVTKQGIKKDINLPEKINKAIIPGIQGGPHMNTIAAIGVALKEDSGIKFKKYCLQIVKNAKKLAEELKKYKFDIVTGGTDCHLILIDLRNKKLLGNTVATACESAGIVLNRNAVPHDTNPPFYPSGIRLGTPGLTSRKMKEKEMVMIAKWINEIVGSLQKAKNDLNLDISHEKERKLRLKLINYCDSINKINLQVKKLCKKFPVKKAY